MNLLGQESFNLLPILGAILILGLLFFIFWKTLKLLFKITVVVASIAIAIKIYTLVSAYF